MARLHLNPIFTRSVELTVDQIVEGITVEVALELTGEAAGVTQDACGREIVNFCFPAGDNPTVKVALTKTSDGTAIDLTGASAVLTVVTVNDATSPATITELFELTGDIQSPETDGIIHFKPTTTQANSGGVAAYRYDVQVTFADGTRRTLVVGDWIYDQDYADTGEN